MAETCPKCGSAVHDEATAHPICCECGWDALEWERAENARLRGQLAEAKAQRDKLLYELVDLHCRIASVCFWDLKGKPFEEALRERFAQERRAGLEEAAVDCERRQCHGQAAILRRLAQPPAEDPLDPPAAEDAPRYPAGIGCEQDIDNAAFENESRRLAQQDGEKEVE